MTSMRHATYGLVKQQTGARRTGQGSVYSGLKSLSVFGSRSQAKDHGLGTVRTANRHTLILRTFFLFLLLRIILPLKYRKLPCRVALAREHCWGGQETPLALPSPPTRSRENLIILASTVVLHAFYCAVVGVKISQ